MSTTRMSTLSIHPPEKPAMLPTMTPMKTMMRTAAKPIISDVPVAAMSTPKML